jgi:glucans biosynthesis protein
MSASAEPLANAVPFAADTVLKAAMALATQPFKAPDAPGLPSQFSGLNFDQYASIRRQPGTALWANEKLGFSLEPLHRGFVYTAPIVINIVDAGLSQRMVYDPADYDFGKLQPPTGAGDLGFSGLRILAASDQGFDDVAIFQGRASIARAPAGRISASTRGGSRSAPATIRARSFRSSASSGSRSRPPPRTR